MSLGKLLATGRSLVGGAPDEGRYNISSRNRLPKFGSAKNPFAPSTTSEPQVAATGSYGADKPVRMEAAALPAVRHEETQRIPELAEQPFGAVRQTSQLSGKGESFASRTMVASSAAAATVGSWTKMILQKVRSVKWGPLATELWTQLSRIGPLGRVAMTKIRSLFGKLTGLFRKPEPKSVIPRFGKPAVQTELSLDHVKVVRNNLEDSDLEIVAAETATSTQVAPKLPVASPKRGPVPPALKKMTERLLGMQALD